MVKRLRRRPLTAESGVRFPMSHGGIWGSIPHEGTNEKQHFGAVFHVFPQKGTKIKRQHNGVAVLFWRKGESNAAKLCENSETNGDGVKMFILGRIRPS